MIEKYGATEYVYVMSHSSVCLEEFHALYPSVHRCKGYSDDGYVDEARAFLEMGIDTVLTNDYLRIKNGTLDLIPWKE